MRTIDTLPPEMESSIISSIINLVCPQCGGSMMEFQCCGRCRRNWLSEWEWANRDMRYVDNVAKGSRARFKQGVLAE